MRAHWRRWLAVGVAVLAALIVGIVVVPPLLNRGAPDKPSQLEVNLVSQPLAVQAASGIWFSWATDDPRSGQYQRGYELRVAAKPADLAQNGKSLWDSGTVTSGSPGASYHGPALADGTRYWWTVRTTDAQGHAGNWAVPAQFGTALGATWNVPAGLGARPAERHRERVGVPAR